MLSGMETLGVDEDGEGKKDQEKKDVKETRGKVIVFENGEWKEVGKGAGNKNGSKQDEAKGDDEMKMD